MFSSFKWMVVSVFVGLFLLAVVYWAARAWQDQTEWEQLQKSSVTTQGQVTWRDMERPMFSIGSNSGIFGFYDYVVTYRFDVNGKRYTKDEIVTEEIYGRAHLYSPVMVQYVRENPAVSRIVGNTSHASFDASMLVVFAIILILVILLPGRMQGTTDDYA